LKVGKSKNWTIDTKGYNKDLESLDKIEVNQAGYGIVKYGTDDEDTIIQLTDDVCTLFMNDDADSDYKCGEFTNTSPNVKPRRGKTIQLMIAFNTPIAITSFPKVPFDPFIFSKGNFEKQIHMSNTNGIDSGGSQDYFYKDSATPEEKKLFKDDCSNTQNCVLQGGTPTDNSNRWYVNNQGLPYVMEVTGDVTWASEQQRIDAVWPRVAGWFSNPYDDNGTPLSLHEFMEDEKSKGKFRADKAFTGGMGNSVQKPFHHDGGKGTFRPARDFRELAYYQGRKCIGQNTPTVTCRQYNHAHPNNEQQCGTECPSPLFFDNSAPMTTRYFVKDYSSSNPNWIENGACLHVKPGNEGYSNKEQDHWHAGSGHDEKSECLSHANDHFWCEYSCSDSKPLCGTSCCASGQTCNNGACVNSTSCTGSEIACGNNCCTSGQTCTSGVCVNPTSCTGSETVCGNNCCTSGQTCTSGACVDPATVNCPTDLATNYSIKGGAFQESHYSLGSCFHIASSSDKHWHNEQDKTKCENHKKDHYWCIPVKPACSPTTETCNNKDDDCDGSVDENVVRVCGKDTGECKKGNQTCSTGNWGTCVGEVKPATESCNNKDDDCDGDIDEDFTKKGQSCSAGQGECKCTGIFVCKSNNSDTECSVTAGSSTTETCDGKDNDCDGSVDENVVRVCGNDTGECKKGSQTCSTGNWGTCVGEVNPATESCNNKDDDCDGSVDEGFNLQTDSQNCGSCGNVCTSGQTCTSGTCLNTAQITVENVQGNCNSWTNKTTFTSKMNTFGFPSALITHLKDTDTKVICCNGEDACKDKTVDKCDAGKNCVIYCNGKASCKGNAKIKGKNVTSQDKKLVIICSGEDSCQDAELTLNNKSKDNDAYIRCNGKASCKGSLKLKNYDKNKCYRKVTGTDAGDDGHLKNTSKCKKSF
jgi:hypothetical protein